jgi:hypothetical protein
MDEGLSKTLGLQQPLEMQLVKKGSFTNQPSRFGIIGIWGKQVVKVSHIVGYSRGYGCPVLELENS